ncbi:MGH1-like glycoside hydrolase domain-containing protein [Candidatus Nitronereus thalassa]|uniref:Glucosidase n=1 Tax=Candidatus Nitronereus thalassa TaxID=3020898 RepID=A0ABU3K5Q9_9BACT|nr:glucosidase [Candidatus Nitronereus thalassa]MDT7041711.1 glucosidase [Candidatus Nitronereus thalassa]
MSKLTKEEQRLDASRKRLAHWKRWGPYLSERQWGTVREDYSPDGHAWQYFPHDQARSRAYRWGEDGIGGLCDRHQYLCFALTLWNEQDPILKERLFGLANHEGNHGEDVKESYFYLDSTPTHSYMKFLYKYPQAPFPYSQLVEENQRRDRQQPEYELSDTGIFNEHRYFDVFIEYAKSTPEDILIKVTAYNRGAVAAPLVLLPTLWFRNTWSWQRSAAKPNISLETHSPSGQAIRAEHSHYGQRWLLYEDTPQLLFTENETNLERIWGQPNPTPFVKDSFHNYLIHQKSDCINPNLTGTKAAGHYHRTIPAGESVTIRLRLTDQPPGEHPFGTGFDRIMETRIAEADEFYAQRMPELSTKEAKAIQRQAFAGLLWSKQFYHYDVATWLVGDEAGPNAHPHRNSSRNQDWRHLYNADVISMPDKWEYPWYATWDLAFHCVPFALIDPDFAKDQLILLLREWYLHPNGQLPAYEWDFNDVNPPVHAWAVWRVYKIERRIRGQADRKFLERAFHKLLLNFTWWVNRKDAQGKNLFQGGFMGLDNIGVFDRSQPLPTGGHLDQSDTTSWMGMFCLNMLAIALELARDNSAYESVASKFFDHFVYINHAMNGRGDDCLNLWDDEDGFYYDVLNLPHGEQRFLKIRSLVGLIPLFAVLTLEPETLSQLPNFHERMMWFLKNRQEFRTNVGTQVREDGSIRYLLSLVSEERLRRVLHHMLQEEEFLSTFGIRSLSRHHRDHPFEFHVNGTEYRVAYEPGESRSPMFGGNSNWRGPIWFPLNYLLIESLQKFHYFFRESFTIECPTNSGPVLNLWEVGGELAARLMAIFHQHPSDNRPIWPADHIAQHDPFWRDHLLFHEFFHGETGQGLGASHQTGWTALIAKLLEQYGDELISTKVIS